MMKDGEICIPQSQAQLEEIPGSSVSNTCHQILKCLLLTEAFPQLFFMSEGGYFIQRNSQEVFGVSHLIS